MGLAAMTMFPTAFLSEITDSSNVISAGKRAYFQERFRNQLYNLIISEFVKRQNADPHFTQSSLARRIEKRPEQINRWLSSPGNWTIDTISDLLLGISGAEPEMNVSILSEQHSQNYNYPYWLTSEPYYIRVGRTTPLQQEITSTESSVVAIGAGHE
jgi:hypothetical protein